MDEKVLVTGASGYIAMHIVNILQSERYHVVATVESAEVARRIATSYEHYYPYAVLDVLVVPDVTAPDAFEPVFQQHPDIRHVIHTAPAAPLGNAKDTREAYLVPATEGTRNVLQSIRNHGRQVSRVVITSSFAALMDLDHAADPQCVISETSWNPVTWEAAQHSNSKAYAASKRIAEQLVWDWYREHQHDVRFTLTTVNPPYMFGPHVFDWELERPEWNTTACFIKEALKLTPDSPGPFIKPRGICCDVRDAALIHVLPLRNSDLAGQRLFPVNGTGIKQHSYEDGKFNFQRILDIMNAEFPNIRGSIPEGNPGAANQENLNQLTRYNNDDTCQLTGMEFKPFALSLRDATKQILQFQTRHA